MSAPCGHDSAASATAVVQACAGAMETRRRIRPPRVDRRRIRTVTQAGGGDSQREFSTAERCGPLCCKRPKWHTRPHLACIRCSSICIRKARRDFFRLGLQRIRWLLLDRAKQGDRSRREMRAVAVDEAYNRQTGDDGPPAIAKLYQQMEELPETEREVVDLLYFHGLSQPEVAKLLAVTERTVRRHWAAARIKLAAGLTPPN